MACRMREVGRRMVGVLKAGISRTPVRHANPGEPKPNNQGQLSGLQRLIIEEATLIAGINKWRETRAKLEGQYLQKDRERLKAIRQGNFQLAQAIAFEISTLFNAMGPLEAEIAILERERERFGWRLNAERHRDRDV